MIVPTKANGALIVTGVSGGEFGVVGRVEARSAETGELVWSRPVLEGLTGTYKGKETTMTGKANESWPGDMYKFGGGAPGSAAPTIRRPSLASSAPAIRRPGIPGCVRATTSGRRRASRSTRRTAR